MNSGVSRDFDKDAGHLSCQSLYCNQQWPNLYSLQSQYCKKGVSEMNEKKIICPYCISDAESYELYGRRIFITCPTCGRFDCQVLPFFSYTDIKDKVASYLYYTGGNGERKDLGFYNYLGSYQMYEKEHVNNTHSHCVSKDEIEAFYPHNISEQIDRILLGIAEQSDFFGDCVMFKTQELISAFFIRRFDKNGNDISKELVNSQISEINEYLSDKKYVRVSYYENETGYTILPNGYARIDELQASSGKSSKNAFVAMSFSDDMKDVREAIKKAITECGYIPRIMDEIEHNHQIVPEMLYEIRQARFIVAELTGHNNGAYFEAGYALGQGKPVIQVCCKKRFGDDGHFDVKQINTVLWETTDDLVERLKSRIQATIE